MFVELSVRPLPSVCVNVVSESAPKLRTAESEISLRSSPTERSAATPAPPATVNAPSEALVFAVVAVIETTPPEEIPIAFVSEELPIVPASAITILLPEVISPVVVRVAVVINPVEGLYVNPVSVSKP